MKLGTVLTTLAASALVAAQPATAATRSASSLPAAGAKVSAVDARVGSTVRQSRNVAAGSEQFLLLVALIGFAAALAFVIIDDGNAPDPLPQSP